MFSIGVHQQCTESAQGEAVAANLRLLTDVMLNLPQYHADAVWLRTPATKLGKNLV